MVCTVQPNWFELVATSYGPWISAGAILISAAVALFAIDRNQRIARKRATIDLVMHLRQNLAVDEARKKVLDFHEQKVDFTTFAKADHKTPENDCILTVLNAYEFVASGVREGAFDEGIYKRMQWSVVIRDWNALENWVTEFRTSRNRPTLYIEFELLAKRWKAKPLKN